MTGKTNYFGNHATTELKVNKSGVALQPGVRVGFTRCFTCNNMCGLRYRVDEATDKITRVSGNPYCEVVTAGAPLPLKLSVAEAYQALAFGRDGKIFRATSCGKGASGIDAVDDPYRVLKVLKRAGKRGEDRWVTIPYEQALEEIIEGGNLFGEGPVEGLRAIRDTKTPLVPGFPEFGVKSNQLFATFNEEDTMRGGFYSRFMRQAFGTVNLTTKHGYCGAPVGVGYAMGLAPEIDAGMCDVDWDNFEFAIFIGTAPGCSGASINRTGSGLSNARVNRKAKYVCVDPILRGNVVNNTNAQWVPVKPGEDTAFLLAVMQVILNKGRENKKFLSNPNEASAKKNGEINWSNASYLVNIETNQLADAADFGIGDKGDGVVYSGGKLLAASKAGSADLYVDRPFSNSASKTIRYKSTLQLLKEKANEHSLKYLSNVCGVPVEVIESVAKEFTSHGTKVVAVSNTGNNGWDSVMSSWLICLLNTLAGSHDRKGGAIYGNGAFMGFGGNYDLENVEGAVEQEGVVSVCRNYRYEDSTEYAEHVKKGENPYPAKHVYRPLASDYTGLNAAEMITAIANEEPYKAKALINWRSNPVYSAGSLPCEAETALRDTRKLPLFIAIDAFVTETNRNADYIIPDRVMFEEYGCDRTWGNFDQCVTAGVPVVTPRTALTSDGRHICMEEFFFDVAKKLNLPGFGEGAVPVKEGGKAALKRFDDWYAYYLSNVASQCGSLPKVTDSDRELAALPRAMKPLQNILSAKQCEQVEALLSRGGYYEKSEKYDGDFLANGGGKFLQIFNPAIAAQKHCYSGENYPGIPCYEPPKFFDGSLWEKHWDKKQYPLVLATYKPILRSNYSGFFDHCNQVSPQNFVYMNGNTAKQFGLKDKERVILTSPDGITAEGVLACDDGVAEKAVCVAHAYGHWAGGAEVREVDGKSLPVSRRRGGGIAINRLIPIDPTRPGAVKMLNDYYAAANCRSGIPIKVEPYRELNPTGCPVM
ncbi:molybdopterin-dependent oxidoreductase [uncultured Parasutterella sp.]|uniref:molybdopterin-dependent oxidoreductase n=1 Tax=uncultured Parasutterella sp. TaxID=1263098 RepID=UPI0027120987|nr:molybdopterin-dependent oxidoreductase [uncultured Parasutterella sp.]